MKKVYISTSVLVWLLVIFFFSGFVDAQEPKLEDAKAYYHSGLDYLQKGQHDKAISNFNKAIDLNPSDFTVYVARSSAYQQKGQYDKAISDCDKAIDLNPSHPGAYALRGLIYSQKGQHDKAISDINKAKDLSEAQNPTVSPTVK